MKKSMFAVVLLSCSIFVSIPTFCEANVMYSGNVIQSKNNRRNERSSIIVSKKTTEIKNTPKEIFPVSLSRQEARIVYLGQKIPFTEIIDTPYQFVRDISGNIKLMYIQERLNIPIVANGGFYVVQKYNNVTNTIEWEKYCVDNSGYILFGWIVEDDGTKYYLSEDEATLGQVVKGAMLFKNGITCYFDSDGILQNMERAVDVEEKGEMQYNVNYTSLDDNYDLENLGPKI